MICKNPLAKLNQCAWICKKNPSSEKRSCRVAPRGNAHCLRYRCDANGRWTDETEIPGTKGALQCKLDPFVSTCDY